MFLTVSALIPREVQLPGEEEHLYESVEFTVRISRYSLVISKLYQVCTERNFITQCHLTDCLPEFYPVFLAVLIAW